MKKYHNFDFCRKIINYTWLSLEVEHHEIRIKCNESEGEHFDSANRPPYLRAYQICMAENSSYCKE